jgi:hypothetical protein
MIHASKFLVMYNEHHSSVSCGKTEEGVINFRGPEKEMFELSVGE